MTEKLDLENNKQKVYLEKRLQKSFKENEFIINDNLITIFNKDFEETIRILENIGIHYNDDLYELLDKEIFIPIEIDLSLILTSFPEYTKLKNKYQLMWDQTDCIDYIKTSAVLAAYTDQSISTNTFWNPANYSDKKIPSHTVMTNLILGYKWGLKTFYYSIMNKQGMKETTKIQKNIIINEEVEEDCEACKL